MSTFHEKLKEYRERLGMMQSILAERIGITKSHLNRIEKGLRPPPQVDTVVSMAQELRLTRNEAEEFIRLAGYSRVALDTGEGLVYNSPEMSPHPLYDKLFTVLSELAPEDQEKCINALLELIKTLRKTKGQTTKVGINGENDE